MRRLLVLLLLLASPAWAQPGAVRILTDDGVPVGSSNPLPTSGSAAASSSSILANQGAATGTLTNGWPVRLCDATGTCITLSSGSVIVQIASNSGANTVQPGNTPNTSAWLVQATPTVNNAQVSASNPLPVLATPTTNNAVVSQTNRFPVATDTGLNFAQGTPPATQTAGNYGPHVHFTDGAMFVRDQGAVIWSCGLAAQAGSITECQAAPGNSLRLYVTDLTAQTNTATPGKYSLITGTGTNCGTGTTYLYPNSANKGFIAATGTNTNFKTPLVGVVNGAICASGTATNTINLMLNGYTSQ